jgi:hypothetical protein
MKLTKLYYKYNIYEIVNKILKRDRCWTHVVKENFVLKKR